MVDAVMAARARGWLVRGFTLAAALASARGVEANGRFPTANYFVAGPGSTNDVLTLRTTFGLMISRDGGRGWAWACEEAFDTTGGDPSVSIGSDGRLVLATFTGLYGSDPAYCEWNHVDAPAPTRGFADVTHTADGRSMVALVGPTGDNALLLSADGGRTWTAGASLAGYFTETADVAPNDPGRVYVTGYDRGGRPVMLRSDDGGRTVREAARDFAGADGGIYLAGVDPRSPDVLYVRANRGAGTLLLRSDDGGATLRVVGATRAEMVGFALSDDGETVWMGSADRAEGIQRSTRCGPWTRTAAEVSVRCLRYHAGLLFVCADEAVDGYALGRSFDGGDTIDPLLSLRLLDGSAPACGGATEVGRVCGSLWSGQTLLLRGIDASAPRAPTFPDAGIDAGAVTDGAAGMRCLLPTADVSFDVPMMSTDRGAAVRDAAMDAGAPAADRGPAAPPPAVENCGCRVGAGRSRPSWVLLMLASLVLASRRPRGRRSSPSPGT